MVSRKKLNKYTSLPYLIDALIEQRLSLRSPEAWEDRNDRFYLKRYRSRKRLGTLLAICFTSVDEQFHHWKCFADGASGVCIEFDKRKLLARIKHRVGFRFHAVSYKRVRDVEDIRPDLRTWPFLKREPYRDEQEFRIIYERRRKSSSSVTIDFDSACINRITLSPWLAPSVANTVAGLLKRLPRCENLEIKKSTLLENKRWRRVISPSDVLDE